MPLHNLPEEALAAELAPPTGAPSAAVLRDLIRDCTSHGDLYVARDAHGGHGLFAAAALPMHAFIGEYVGTIQRGHGCDASESSDYLMKYPDGNGGRYICGKASGSLPRFANHSAVGTRECNSAMFCVLCDGTWHQIMMTTRVVEAREELRHDYGQEFWSKEHRAEGLIAGDPLPHSEARSHEVEVR